jgi:bacteriocin-like protein
MERIMSKTKDTTKARELTEAELDAVSGGLNLDLENCHILH